MAEFALVIPLALFIIFAIFEFVLAVHAQIDFNAGLSNAIRVATISSSLNPDEADANTGSALTLAMRPGDVNYSEYYAIRLIESRVLTDASSQSYANPDLYENDYIYNSASDSFATDAYSFFTSSYYHGTVPTPCEYYYEAHTVKTSDGHTDVYVDKDETVLWSTDGTFTSDPTIAAQFPAYLHLDQCGSGSAGSDRMYDQTSSSNNSYHDPTLTGLYPHDGWNCAYAWTGDSASTPAGNVCYYYPDERTSSIDSAADGDAQLTDLIDVSITYKYRPLGTFVSAGTPLGQGFEITDHARGRVEPIALQSQ